MATDKQIAANRANALKSTGPRTGKGKARVSQNARRHARLAETVLMDSEQHDRFRANLEKFYREFQPRTASEMALVDQLGAAHWTFLRASSLEAQSLDREFNRPPEASFDAAPDPSVRERAALAWCRLSDGSTSLNKLQRERSEALRAFTVAYDRLQAVLAKRAAPRRRDNDSLMPPFPAEPVP